MSNEVKFSKFLIGLCLNTGNSFQTIAKNLGISANTTELNNLASQLESRGLISKVKYSSKETFAKLTAKGSKQASILMNSAV
ncbi:hypothetical protein KMW28_16215 [Flammeovirga yaeyamensis]|uniref:Uncharacterized protein n=1 Tax=Flammeovirga yaeyamensis TaxID=367791 RepID=A0AAX1N1F4_9BACT|nr:MULTISPECIES: hypothetical protein [Flammeovirga]ANQ47398.1 hypothetical protein MY04_0015 [Flammeovirga sp. MY04]MBB3698444.1 Mn-dependent DtxR family transcriptional regulator [Flammeovirga yaeyamensis]NMF34206.1 hypothetical protein [Flammeovirga yaeyamensis]QWG01191.1 hypothetical protein KMW28_16215 [Flammeovirga yaeyamensis]